MKLDEMPDRGRVVVGSPRIEDRIRAYAERCGLPYVLSDHAPHDSAFVLDMDALDDELRRAGP